VVTRSWPLLALVAITGVAFAASLAFLDARYCSGIRFDRSSRQIVDVGRHTDAAHVRARFIAGLAFGLAPVGTLIHFLRRSSLRRRRRGL
jgi:hypothetical protein